MQRVKVFWILQEATFLQNVMYILMIEKDIAISNLVFPKHKTVNHQDGYVSKSGVNTNQIESVWKHIRRTFKTHIKVAKHHVYLYAKEAAYKFNKIPSFEIVMLCLI